MEEEEDNWSQSRSWRDNATTNLMFKRLGNIDTCTHICPHPLCLLGTKLEGGENCWGRDAKRLFLLLWWGQMVAPTEPCMKYGPHTRYSLL